jgi:hypothetical protein
MMSDFWSTLDALIADSELVIDRPKGTKHPRNKIYISQDLHFDFHFASTNQQIRGILHFPV